MAQKIKEWIVPQDDAVHEIGGGWIIGVHSDPYMDGAMVVWTMENEEPDPPRRVKVVSVGDWMSEDWRAVGSSAWSGGGLIHSLHLVTPRPSGGYIKS